MNNQVLEDNVVTVEEASTVASPSPGTSVHSVNFSETTTNNGPGTILSERSVSSGQTKTLEMALLDERSLLSCIVRTIPTGGRIQISSTVSGLQIIFLM